MNENFEEVNLPQVSANETLETMSRREFVRLFEPAYFEVRSEDYRDKGIDFSIEIKKNNRYTNFRSVIQLKATNTLEKNSDGSYSLQIKTSNIQYLLNAGLPAYYILYIGQTDKFYFESLDYLIQHFTVNNDKWQEQQNHLIRVSKELNEQTVHEIYEAILRKGMFHREISEMLADKMASVNTGDKLLVDVNLNITDDTKIRGLIEAIGLELINEGRWLEILEVNRKVSANVGSTAKYNLVLGIANYYSANYFEALVYFKKAQQLRIQLTKELQNHLTYYECVIKFYLGLISKIEYEEIIKACERDTNLSLYIRLGKAKSKYYSVALTNRKTAISELLNEIQLIIENAASNDNVQLLAKAERILFVGMDNNMNFFERTCEQYVVEALMGFNIELRKEAAITLIKNNNDWYKEANAVEDEALKKKNYFVFCIAQLNYIKVQYEFTVMAKFTPAIQPIPNFESIPKPDTSEMFERLLTKLDNIYNYFMGLDHIENVCAVLNTKYSVLHFLERFNDSTKIAEELTSLIEAYDMKEHKTSLKHLLDKGTIHEKFEAMVNAISDETKTAQQQWMQMTEEMQQMDESDKKRTHSISYKGRLFIELFPIGNFSFPTERKDRMYEIVGVESKEVKSKIDYLFSSKIIPVININNYPIMEEGYAEGQLDTKGMESGRNIYRIRKAFFTEGFYRREYVS